MGKIQRKMEGANNDENQPHCLWGKISVLKKKTEEKFLSKWKI